MLSVKIGERQKRHDMSNINNVCIIIVIGNIRAC